MPGLELYPALAWTAVRRAFCALVRFGAHVVSARERQHVWRPGVEKIAANVKKGQQLDREEMKEFYRNLDEAAKYMNDRKAGFNSRGQQTADAFIAGCKQLEDFLSKTNLKRPPKEAPDRRVQS